MSIDTLELGFFGSDPFTSSPTWWPSWRNHNINHEEDLRLTFLQLSQSCKSVTKPKAKTFLADTLIGFLVQMKCCLAVIKRTCYRSTNQKTHLVLCCTDMRNKLLLLNWSVSWPWALTGVRCRRLYSVGRVKDGMLCKWLWCRRSSGRLAAHVLLCIF